MPKNGAAALRRAHDWPRLCSGGRLRATDVQRQGLGRGAEGGRAQYRRRRPYSEWLAGDDAVRPKAPILMTVGDIAHSACRESSSETGRGRRHGALEGGVTVI